MTIQPVGSIVAYPGAVAPQGWLLCDGKPIPSGNQYNDLRKLVGATTPYFQGYFLGGFDTAGTVDPSRKLLDTQPDGVGPHTHNIGPAGLSGAGAPNVLAYIDNPQTDESVPSSPETRPKNKSVNFIIKAIEEG